MDNITMAIVGLAVVAVILGIVVIMGVMQTPVETEPVAKPVEEATTPSLPKPISNPQPYCADGECKGDENCLSCPTDCGECPALCGDSSCDPDENCSTCEIDCGECPADIPEMAINCRLYKYVFEQNDYMCFGTAYGWVRKAPTDYINAVSDDYECIATPEEGCMAVKK